MHPSRLLCPVPTTLDVGLGILWLLRKLVENVVKAKSIGSPSSTLYEGVRIEGGTLDTDMLRGKTV